MSLNRQQKLFFTFALLHALNIFSAVMNPFFTQWGGLSLSQITILQSWFTFSIFLLEVPTGVVADVFGRKLSIILGAWISFVSFLAYPQIANFAWFMLWEFALALSFSLISGADQALIHDSARSESESKKTYQIYSSAALAGIMLGPLIGGWLFPWLGLQGVFASTAVPLFFAGIVAFFLPDDGVHRRAPSEKERVWITLHSGVRYFFQHHELRLLALNMSIVASVSKMLIWLYQPKLLALGIDVAWLGPVLSIAVALEIVVMLTAEWWERKFNRAIVIFASSLIPALGMLLVGFSGSAWIAIPAIIVTIGIGMARKPYFAGMFHEHISSHQRATVLSTISMMSSLLTAVIGPAVGWLADRSLEQTVLVLGLVLLVTASLTYHPIAKLQGRAQA